MARFPSLFHPIISLYQRYAAKRMFSQWAAHYEEDVLENHYSAADRVATMAVRVLRPQHRQTNEAPIVIDLGIGTGLLAQQIVDALPARIIGLDFNAEMMSQAESRNIAELLIQCDVGKDHWPATDHSVDMVMSAGLFEYMTPPMVQHIFKETARVLQQNGTFVFTYIPRKDTEKSMTYWQGYSGGFMVCAQSEHELLDIAQQNGLHIESHSAPFAGSVYDDGESYDYRLMVCSKKAA